VGVAYNPNIVTDGLVLCLDAANKRSYPGTGTTWRDLSGNNYDFSLVNSPGFGKHRNTPCFTFSGSNDYALRSGSIDYDVGTSGSVSVVMASINGTNFGSCSRLFSLGASGSNNDYSSYFTTASCNQSKFGLWYRNNPANFYPTSDFKQADDRYFIVTYTWDTSTGTYKIYVNGSQESSTSGTGNPFNYTGIVTMGVGVNSGSLAENSYVRVSCVWLYNKTLTAAEVRRNFNVMRHRFGI
jgi:hypothetical protein